MCLPIMIILYYVEYNHSTIPSYLTADMKENGNMDKSTVLELWSSFPRMLIMEEERNTKDNGRTIDFMGKVIHQSDNNQGYSPVLFANI